jgi:hypothetical protein
MLLRCSFCEEGFGGRASRAAASTAAAMREKIMPWGRWIRACVKRAEVTTRSVEIAYLL